MENMIIQITFEAQLQPLHRHRAVPLPDNGVPDKPACWGEFTGEAEIVMRSN